MVRKFFQYLNRHQVILALFLIAIGWSIFMAKSIIVSLFVSYIIMAALVPMVSFLKGQGMPKLLAVIISYFGVLSAILLLIFPLFSFFSNQVQSLIGNLPLYIDQSANTLGVELDARQIQGYFTQEIDSLGRNAFSVTSKVFGGLFSTLTILIVSFYLLMDHDRFKKWLSSLFHPNDRAKVHDVLQQVDEKLGAWLQGQVLLSVFIGVITWLILMVLGVPNALPLALLAGMLEVIPTLGPILAAIPAVIVALTVSPPLALTVALAYALIQLLENNILVPKIMQRAVGLNPVIVILAVMTGATLMGIPGALLSIPFISFIIVIFNSINETEE